MRGISTLSTLFAGNDSNASRGSLGSFVDRVSSSLNNAYADRPLSDAPSTPDDPKEVTASRKRQALEAARLLASEAGRKPTLEDYQQAAEALGKGNWPENEWNPAVYADLSGQTLTGFLIHENPKPSHTMVAFYDHLHFDQAQLDQCIIDPAASFNTQIRKATLSNTEFKNMADGDTLQLGNGTHTNLKITHCNGGTFILAGAHIEGLEMPGAKLTVFEMRDKAAITGINAKDAHIAEINAEPGCRMVGGDFTNVLISKASRMQGMVFQDVNFTGAHLADCDFTKAEFTHVTLPNEVKGANFTGATFDHAKFEDGTAVTAQQLAERGATVASQQFAVAAPITEKTAGQPDAHPLAALIGGMKLAGGLNLSGISGGETADHNSITPGNPLIAQQEKLKAAEKTNDFNKKDGGFDRSYYARMSESGGTRNS